MLVTNANSADYSAIVVELLRRHARGWEMNGSYTWSRALGDAEEFNQLLGDDPSALQEERSYISYDQRHVFKLNAAVDTPSLAPGRTLRYESGLPYSIVESVDSYVGFVPQYELEPRRASSGIATSPESATTSATPRSGPWTSGWPASSACGEGPPPGSRSRCSTR